MQFTDIFGSNTAPFENFGFLFGAGTSKEAGYPLTNELTGKVFGNLKKDEQKIIENLLKIEKKSFDSKTGEPDIEYISDLVNKVRVSNNEPNLIALEEEIKHQIVKVLSSVNTPHLDTHVNFLKHLKNAIGSNQRTIWIFTTNYDLVFEHAAFEAKIPIVNGFEGVGKRYFDFKKYYMDKGVVGKENNFKKTPELTIHLIKLHGSISWFKNEQNFYEDCSSIGKNPTDSCLVLPHKRKITEMYEFPFNKYFTYVKEILGDKCKYIFSCGYSFRDPHINELFTEPLRQGKIKLFSVVQNHPEAFDEFKKFDSFSFLTEEKGFVQGEALEGKFDLWKFDEMVKFIQGI